MMYYTKKPITLIKCIDAASGWLIVEALDRVPFQHKIKSRWFFYAYHINNKVEVTSKLWQQPILSRLGYANVFDIIVFAIHFASIGWDIHCRRAVEKPMRLHTRTSANSDQTHRRSVVNQRIQCQTKMFIIKTMIRYLTQYSCYNNHHISWLPINQENTSELSNLARLFCGK